MIESFVAVLDFFRDALVTALTVRALILEIKKYQLEIKKLRRGE